MQDSNLYKYLLSLGDNSMILGHRLSELCGHGPSLETDIALTNISLDLFGEVRNYFQYAAKLKGDGCTEDLCKSSNEQLAAIATKSLKEATYHVRFSSDWVKRLGDGTEESRAKMQEAINDLYPFTGELIVPSTVEKLAFEEGYGTDIDALKETYLSNVHQVLNEATLNIPETPYRYAKGKEGFHSEYLDYILQEFQYMQKTYPNMQW